MRKNIGSYKKNIRLDDSLMVEAYAPLIISASRSTDIPAFYAEWFFHRLNVGYSIWKNPYTGKRSYISYEDTQFIVFWSKNPASLLDYVDFLEKRNIGFYIQYTLNDYVRENLEKNVPPLSFRIDTFKRLVDRLGKGRVIWRFDPLILTDSITLDDLLAKISFIGDQLYGYTEKMVFSFADISNYKKVQRNLSMANVHYHEFTDQLMLQFSESLIALNQRWNYELSTCGEKIDLYRFGIQHNRCIDDRLLIRFGHDSKSLMEHLNVKFYSSLAELSGQKTLFDEEMEDKDIIKIDDKNYAVIQKNNKDKGQRLYCGCISSKDIGEYNTCPHLCAYCYANMDDPIVLSNWKSHKKNPFNETISGK